MSIWQLVILAIVQGLTEFIPVSSSAHLILTSEVLKWADQGRAIDVAAHVGSLGAVLIYFRADTAKLFQGGIDTVRWRASAERQLFIYLAIATIPLVVLGGLIALSPIGDHLRSPHLIGVGSIVFGILLWWADRRPVSVEGSPRTWRAVLTIGAAQAVAIFPGTSRSGITITAARWLGFDRENAARFSMLLAIPAILASGAFEFIKMLGEGGNAPWGGMFTVALFGFLAAWASIAVFMRLTRRMSFTPFVIYRIVLGIVLLVMF